MQRHCPRKYRSLQFENMTQLGREDRTVHHDSRSKSELSRDLSPSIQPASGSASENELGERPVREKLKKASLATISGQSAPPSLEQSKDGTSTSAPATAALVTASENGSAPKEENRGRPLKKRSFDDLDLAGTEGTALHEEGPDYINGHARKRSRDVRTDVRQRASDKPSVTSPLHEALEDGPTSKSALDPAISDVSLGSTGEMPDANIDYAPGRGIDDGGGNAKQTSNLSDNGSPETEEAAPQGVRRADADQEFGEGAASPRKKRSRDQLDTEHDREQKIAATEGLRAQRLSSELDRSEGSALAEKNAAPLEASDLGQRQDSEQSERSTVSCGQSHMLDALLIVSQEHSKSTFGNCSTHSAGGIPAKALLSSTASTQQSITPSAFASSGFAALANSSTSPFGIIGAAPTNNIGNTVAASANGVNASKASLRESKFSNPPTIGGFGSFATVSASGFGNIGPSAFAVAGSAKPGLFGGSVFGGGFSEGVGSSSKLANFAAPKGDANIGGTNGAIKPIGSPEEEGEEDGRDSDSEGGEAVGLKKDDIEAEVDERFQHQDGIAPLTEVLDKD